MRSVLAAMLAVLVAGSVSPAALGAGQCTEPQELDRFRLLRRLSLDLKHEPPTYDGYMDLEFEDDVPDWMIDEILASTEFGAAMRRVHAAWFLPNVSFVKFNGVSVRLRKEQVEGEAIWAVTGNGRRKTWRKSPSGMICGAHEQTEFEGGGGPGAAPIPMELDEGNPKGALLDGWVWVQPYWAPETTIKVCAFDAQVAAVGTNGQPCDGSTAVNDPGCGCGENLRWCYGPLASVDQKIWGSMREQLSMLVDAVSSGDRPYSDLVLTPSLWTNGALDFWRQHLAGLMTPTRSMDLVGPGDAELPDDPSFVDDTWVERTRGWPHAGVQTTAAYTLRFNTNRARANRFRILFTNQAFVPPAASSQEGCSETTPDLTQRCVCKDCHQVVEPLAAYWAWNAEAGSGLLTDEAIFPSYNPDCDPTNPDAKKTARETFCQRFYVTETDEGTVNPGILRPLQYADETPGADPIYQQIASHAAQGPGGWADLLVQTGVFYQAMVRNLWTVLMGRDMNLDLTDPDHEVGLLAELAAEFQGHDSLPELVKSLVALPQYRRVR